MSISTRTGWMPGGWTPGSAPVSFPTWSPTRGWSRWPSGGFCSERPARSQAPTSSSWASTGTSRPRAPPGRLMTRLTSDVEALQELISSGLVSTVGDVALLAGTASVLLWMNARLALVVFAVLPALVLFVELLKKFIREANREMRRKLARLNAYLQEHVSGVAVVKALVHEEKSVRGFDARNEEYCAESIRLTNFYSVYFPGAELFASVAVALLLWQGGIGVIAGAVTLA